jgi:uncharacterized protein GlcG (DUF336 family)
VWRRLSVIAAALAALHGCGGGSGGAGTPACTENCSTARNVLTSEDVERVIAQAVGEAQARGVRAEIAVVDRVGNVLAVFRMEGAPATIALSSGRGVSAGLDGIPQGTVPASLSAIAKAITGAYLSSQGNAFTTRTAGQIVQEHFNPNEAHMPSGPLYGVQFSQLPCSDVNKPMNGVPDGPKRSPLGLSADPGGLPLYKNGVLAGGIGVEANGRYGLDRDLTDIDEDDEEVVAVAGTSGFAAPDDIRADRITADGRTLRYADSQALRSSPSQVPAFASLPGALVTVPGYKGVAAALSGIPYGIHPSGIRPDTGAFAASGGWILVDYFGNGNRFPPRADAFGSVSAEDVVAILDEALAVAGRARAQIRRPLGSSAHVTISLVDRTGDILGLVRTSDGPVFGIDVSVQKARTALFFSHPDAEIELRLAPAALYLNGVTVPIGPYADAFHAFTGVSLGEGSIAWSARAIGNLHRPFYPDGLENSPPGPLSKPEASWSPLNVGFQLDVSYNQFIKGVLGDQTTGCAGRSPAGTVETPTSLSRQIGRLRNGAQIFPGGVPIYRGNQLVGAIGVSGDGVDQDDMIAYLALENAAKRGATGLTNAPRERRADTLAPLGVRLRYVQCPQSPFNGSSEQNVCG